MGLKKRNKVSAEFSMSSLTDIIFLLLIFFMLTATFVKIQPFALPKSDSKTVAPTSLVVSIEKDGTHKVNDKATAINSLESAMRNVTSTAANTEFTVVTIVAEEGAKFDDVVNVMNIAAKMKLRAIIATEPKS